MPIDMGIPVDFAMIDFIFDASCTLFLTPVKFINASSILYISISGDISLSKDITRLDMSPYKAKFVEKTYTLLLSIMSLTLKTGSPILIPRAFASLLRAIIHPSLLERTTIGLCFNPGLKTRSQEA